jgi:predicted transcriptional regulator
MRRIRGGSMTKTLTIRVKSLHEALQGFRTTFKAVAAGQRVVKREGVYVTSIEAARNLLTPSRLALLRVIRNKRPGSIYELAKLVGRDFKNVQGDLKLLEKYSLVRLDRGRRTGKRVVKAPRVVCSEIALKIAI